ncbi:glycerate kinase [Escherichia coli O153/O178:H7]
MKIVIAPDSFKESLSAEKCCQAIKAGFSTLFPDAGNDSNLLIVFYVQIMPDDFVMQLHRF